MHVRPPGQEPGPRELRVATYNVHDLRDDREVLLHVLRSLRADVLLLQEVPRRLGAGPRLRALARQAGLAVAASGRGSGGTAVLVHPRLDVVQGRVHRLPVAGMATRTRGVAVAGLRLPDGGPLTAASVHLPLRQVERLVHARQVLRRITDLPPGPVLLGGDLNEPPDGPAWTAFAGVLHELAPSSGPTFPARAPDRRIDGLFASGDVAASAARVAGDGDGLPGQLLARASDHLPLVADLVLR